MTEARPHMESGSEGQTDTGTRRRQHANVGPLIAAGVLVASGGVLLFKSFQIAGGLSVQGPRFMPTVVAVAWLVLAIAYGLQQLPRRGRLSAEAESSPPLLPRKGLLVLLVAVLAGYAFMLPIVGYVPTTVAFFVTVARILGSRHVVRDVIVGALLAAGSFYVFSSLLSIALPLGVFGS